MWLICVQGLTGTHKVATVHAHPAMQAGTLCSCGSSTFPCPPSEVAAAKCSSCGSDASWVVLLKQLHEGRIDPLPGINAPAGHRQQGSQGEHERVGRHFPCNKQAGLGR